MCPQAKTQGVVIKHCMSVCAVQRNATVQGGNINPLNTAIEIVHQCLHIHIFLLVVMSFLGISSNAS